MPDDRLDNGEFRLPSIRHFLTRCWDLACDPRHLARICVFLAKYLFTVSFGYLSYLRSLARRQTDFVEEQWHGLQDLSATKKVAVFSHFDRQGELHDFVSCYLRQLAEADFTVIFVSNAPHLPEATIARLRPWCALILRRANVGYDFGAYKDGIARIPDLHRLDALLLANDSVYGPFHPLKDIVARMDRSADVWGITDSLERHHHLQSYFLLFSPAALRSASFSRFWARFRYVNSKYWIISSGEVGLSRDLSAAGLRCQALFPCSAATAALLQAFSVDQNRRIMSVDPAQRMFLRRLVFSVSRNRPVNSTHFFWDFLIVRLGCPFLKRELLRDNPMQVPFVSRWEKVVGSASSYDTGLITSHLAATMPGRPVSDPVPADRPYKPWFAKTGAP